MEKKFTLLACTALTAGLLSGPVMAQENTLRVFTQDVRTTLDPAMSLGNTGFPVANALFDTLLRRDFKANPERTSTQIIPGLAESWSRPTPTTMELKLRDGLTFHNGDALTADDVVFTFERIMDPDSRYVGARFQLGSITMVEAVDQLTVLITTDTPDASLEQLLAYPGSAVLPKEYFNQVGFEAFGQNPVGSGPFALARFAPDEVIELTAFDDYWMGRPNADVLVFREVPEVSARLIALSTGEADIISAVPTDQISSIERLDCCSVQSVLVNSQIVGYKTSHPAVADMRVRQALNLAIDRETLASALWGNYAAPLPAGHQYPEWDAIYDASRSGFRYDQDEARRLLMEGGYNGEKVTFVTAPAYYPNALPAAEAIVEMWRQIGVDAEVQVDENWGAAFRNDDSIAVLNVSDWTIVPDPHATILWTWANNTRWQDGAERQEYIRIGQAARSALDPVERRRLYGQMLDIFETQAPGTVLYRTTEIYGVRDGINWEPYSVYMMDFRASNLSFE